jgi:hypothetical protein
VIRLFICIIVIAILTGGCTQPDTPTVSPAPAPVSHSNFTLPISERGFFMGVVPTPKTIPAATFDDITAAYEETGNIAEVSMAWVSPSGIGQYDKLKQNSLITALRVYGIKPVVTLGFATIKQVPGEGLKYVVDAPVGPAVSQALGGRGKEDRHRLQAGVFLAGQ